mmetsp:Transcript_76340/g.210743  ORF Transcript_76340/g.210743 Transcript_76340/m.210743 type:complete len:325 (+) Transcript_76340:100-1074(+)
MPTSDRDGSLGSSGLCTNFWRRPKRGGNRGQARRCAYGMQLQDQDLVAAGLEKGRGEVERELGALVHPVPPQRMAVDPDVTLPQALRRQEGVLRSAVDLQRSAPEGGAGAGGVRGAEAKRAQLRRLQREAPHEPGARCRRSTEEALGVVQAGPVVHAAHVLHQQVQRPSALGQGNALRAPRPIGDADLGPVHEDLDAITQRPIREGQPRCCSSGPTQAPVEREAVEVPHGLQRRQLRAFLDLRRARRKGPKVLEERRHLAQFNAAVGTFGDRRGLVRGLAEGRGQRSPHGLEKVAAVQSDVVVPRLTDGRTVVVGGDVRQEVEP